MKIIFTPNDLLRAIELLSDAKGLRGSFTATFYNGSPNLGEVVATPYVVAEQKDADK